MNREVDLAYAAGIMDGEGTVTIVRDDWDRKIYNPKFVLLLTVNMCEREAVDLLCHLFGGTIVLQRHHPPARDSWKWDLRGPRGANALRAILPYLRVKQAQAHICIELQENIEAAKAQRRAFHRHDPSVIAEREKLVAAVRKLNAHGRLYVRRQ